MNTPNIERFKDNAQRAQFVEEVRIVRRRDHIITAFFTAHRPDNRPVYQVLRQIWDTPTPLGEDVSDITTNEIKQVLRWLSDRASYWDAEISKLEAGAEVVDESSDDANTRTS